jgi:hypothetical protein
LKVYSEMFRSFFGTVASSSFRFVMGFPPTGMTPMVNTNSLFQLNQIANFSKFISHARKKRLPLTTKRAGKGYYKGNRTRKEGYLNSKGRFIGI